MSDVTVKHMDPPCTIDARLIEAARESPGATIVNNRILSTGERVLVIVAVGEKADRLARALSNVLPVLREIGSE